MITIIFAPPRTGKTCFMTHIARETAFDYERNKRMRMEILNKRQNGFTTIHTIPQHCVSANYDMIFHRYGYSPRFSRRINPYRLGFANPFVETHFNLPSECICITEAQKYLNSRMSIYFPDWQSRWYEQHGHNDANGRNYGKLYTVLIRERRRTARRVLPKEGESSSMINYNKNKLINECLEKYYETFSRMLDTADFVPEAYNDKILRYIFKNMKRAFRKVDREDRRYQKALRKKTKAKNKKEKGGQ